MQRLDREKLLKKYGWGVLDWRYDHTEFEVMRKIYGDIEADHLLAGRQRGEKIIMNHIWE